MSRSNNVVGENVSGTKVSAPKRVNKSAENKDFFSFLLLSHFSDFRCCLLISWSGPIKLFTAVIMNDCNKLECFVPGKHLHL
jgi:hypothetical protein